MRIHAFFLLIFLLCIFNIDAQYKSPELACVQQVTSGGTKNVLTWRLPNEACGSFVAYYIFYSVNGAPFVILDSVKTQTVNSYTHNSSQSCCYYMTSRYNCAGVSLISDTLCSDNIPMPDLQSISIENGYPVYHWTPMTSIKRVHAYSTFYPNVRPLDTIIGRDHGLYIDSSFNVSSGVYYGGLYALDSCQGIYGKSPPIAHKTCFLTMNSAPCKDEFDVSWTIYQGWNAINEVKEYDVLIKINSELEKVVSTNDSAIRTFNYNQYKFGDTVCIRINAKHPSILGIYSYSNQICFVSAKSQIPDLFHLLEASFISKNKANIRWYCSPSSIPKYFDLSVTNSRSQKEIRMLEKVQFTNEGNGFYSYIDTNADETRQTTYIPIFTDQCNNHSRAIYGNTLYLNAKQVGLYNNEISWSPKLFHDSILYSKSKYELYFSQDNQSFSLLATIDSDKTSYIQNVESLMYGDGKFYYKVKLDYKIDTTSNIKNIQYTDYSQTDSIVMRTICWVPNAFKMNGVNPSFKPKMVFYHGQGYVMKIFNRWGNQVYETTDYLQGWSGEMDNGKIAPEEGYSYLIKYIGNDGNAVEKSGTFVLLK